MKKLFGFACVSLLVATGCSEEETVDRTTTDAGSDTGAETSVDTGVADSGGTATEAGDVGDAGSDSTRPADCITTDAASYFEILDSSKCIVARYTVPNPGVSATWGRHGGPLAFVGGSEVSLVRYELPAGATGELTSKTQKVALSGVGSSVFWNSNAVDLPFFGWTGFAYTGAGASGELFLVDSTGLRARYAMRGLYDMVGLGAASGGRLVYTGLSELSTAAPTTSKSALWAADSCGTPAASPRLIPDGDATCKAPAEIGAWQPGSSGPVSADPSDNVFAVLNNDGITSELRAFERSTIAKGGGAATGTPVVSSTEYFQNLAADGKSVFFRTDAWPPANLELKAATYSTDASTKTLTPGAATTFAKLAKPATGGMSMFVDSSRRLWLVMPTASSGDAGPTSTTFFVIANKP